MDTTPSSLRSSSDAFVARLAEISEMEREKRDMPSSSAQFPAMAEKVERAVRLLLGHAGVQRELCWEAHTAQLDFKIRDLPSGTSVTQLLAKWREAERRLEAVDAQSEEALDLRLDIETYRRAYHTASHANGGTAPAVA